MAILPDLLGGLANPYGTPSRGEWNLDNASFIAETGNIQPITFFVAKPDAVEEPRNNRTGMESITDTGGRRLAKYEYPYRNGQDIEDLGRKAEKWSFQITFFGSGYLARLNKFQNIVIGQGVRGKLVHPIRGVMKARLEDYEFVHSHDQFNAVKLRVTFVEDNTDELQGANKVVVSTNTVIRQAFNFINSAQQTIGNGIFAVGAVLLLPNAIMNAMSLRLHSITDGLSGLLGQLAGAFSSSAKVKELLGVSSGSSISSSVSAGSTFGTTPDGTVLPPVFQVGLSAGDVTAAQSQQQSLASAAPISVQQLVFNTNQQRAAIAAAIAELELYMGSNGSELILSYRELSVQFQRTVEAAISSAQSTLVQYVVPYRMSLRRVAYINGLTADRQNDILNLNPEVESINFVEKGTVLSVPSS